MKKLITALAAAAMTIAMTTASFAAEDPAALLERVNQKANEMDSMDCDMEVHAALIGSDSDGGDLTLNMDMLMDVKMDQIKSENLRYKADVVMEFMGQTETGVVFYKDGYYYTDVGGTKIKYPMDLDAMIKSIDQTTAAADLTPAMMKSLSVREEGENRILSYEANPALMDAYLKEALDSILGDMGISMIIREVKGEYVINKDDYYTDMDMFVVMDMSMYGETIRLIMLMEGTINNPGQPVTVELPPTAGYTDLTSYYTSSLSGSNGRGPASEIR